MSDAIDIRGAAEHNLRAVDVQVPWGSFTVVTGVSGSGKSSLAFDTIFREGQRRFLTALSPYARRFLDRMHRPVADHFGGLPPALLVDQKTTVRNPRSTVGTLTELHDHLRLLFARVGVADRRSISTTHWSAGSRDGQAGRPRRSFGRHVKDGIAGWSTPIWLGGRIPFRAVATASSR